MVVGGFVSACLCSRHTDTAVVVGGEAHGIPGSCVIAAAVRFKSKHSGAGGREIALPAWLARPV
jgi:hypothetical protein